VRAAQAAVVHVHACRNQWCQDTKALDLQRVMETMTINGTQPIDSSQVNSKCPLDDLQGDLLRHTACNIPTQYLLGIVVSNIHQLAASIKDFSDQSTRPCAKLSRPLCSAHYLSHPLHQPHHCACMFQLPKMHRPGNIVWSSGYTQQPCQSINVP